MPSKNVGSPFSVKAGPFTPSRVAGAFGSSPPVSDASANTITAPTPASGNPRREKCMCGSFVCREHGANVPSPQERLLHGAVNVGEPELAALVLERQLLVVES